jgi:predicted PurR-regulated permease PerM
MTSGVLADEKTAAGDRPTAEVAGPRDRERRSSPLLVAVQAAVGVALVGLLGVAVVVARQMLILTALAFFLAIGFDPLVVRLQRLGLRRGVAVSVVLLLTFALVALFVAVTISPLAAQAAKFERQLPDYVQQVRQHQGTLGRLDQRYHLLNRVSEALSATSGGAGFAKGLLGAGSVVLDAVTGTAVVLVLFTYFLVGLPRSVRVLLCLTPRSRRAEVEPIIDAVFKRTGGFVLGSIISSAIAGAGTFIWLEIVGVPYAGLLAVFVALADLVPIVGSTLGGLVVSLVALTVSLQVAVATAIYYVVYRFLEDYLINPRIFGRTVDLPGLVTIVAILLGGSLLGVIGALFAIPVAATVRFILQDYVYPRLDRM